MEENVGSSPGLLTSCLALDKSLNLSEPQFSHLENYSYLTDLVWRSNKKINDNTWAVEGNLDLKISIKSIRFDEATLLLQERGPPLATSWTQFLWKQESEAFSQVKWMMVDPANLFPTPSFIFLLSTHLHVRNKFFSLQYHFLMETSRLTQMGKRRGENKSPHFFRISINNLIFF